MRSLCSLVLDRPRQHSLKYPSVGSMRTAIFVVRAKQPLAHAPYCRPPPYRVVQLSIRHIVRGAQTPIAHAAPPQPISHGFLPWTFSDAGPPSLWRCSPLGRHPKTFTQAAIRETEPHLGPNPFFD